MRVAVLTLAYNEELLIGAVLKNWAGLITHHLVLHSDKPWNGVELPYDRTEEICQRYGAEFIRLPWTSEEEQRNWGLAYLYDYDYVLIVDADELYTKQDQYTILAMLRDPGTRHDHTDAFKAIKVKTYFKTTQYRLDPMDTHQPIIAVNPKRMLFNEVRMLHNQYAVPVDVTLHNLAYCRGELRTAQKFTQFGHADIVRKDFLERWQNWTPDSDDVRAYGHEKSKAIIDPLPNELQELL